MALTLVSRRFFELKAPLQTNLKDPKTPVFGVHAPSIALPRSRIIDGSATDSTLRDIETIFLVLFAVLSSSSYARLQLVLDTHKANLMPIKIPRVCAGCFAPLQRSLPAMFRVPAHFSSVLSLKYVYKIERRNRVSGRRFCARRKVLDSCCGV